MARYIYYEIRRRYKDELVGYVRAYSDGHLRDFHAMEDAIYRSTRLTVDISCNASGGQRWTEADTLVAMGVPVVIYDPEDRRDERDKYTDETECVSCDWTRLTDFPSMRATSAV